MDNGIKLHVSTSLKGACRSCVIAVIAALAFSGAALFSPLSATPIRPDPKKVVAEPKPPIEFPPARAGWNGSEVAPKPAPNPTFERYGPAGTAREIQESVKTMAMPDLRAVAAILLLILLLRRVRKKQQSAFRSQPSV